MNRHFAGPPGQRARQPVPIRAGIPQFHRRGPVMADREIIPAIGHQDCVRRFVRINRAAKESAALAEDGFQAAGGPTSAPSGKNLLQENVEQAVVVKELLERLEHDNDEGGKGQISRRQAGIVRLRVFVGLTEEEAAEVLGCSSETVTKEFRKAKAKMASYARRERARPEADLGQNFPA